MFVLPMHRVVVILVVKDLFLFFFTVVRNARHARAHVEFQPVRFRSRSSTTEAGSDTFEFLQEFCR